MFLAILESEMYFNEWESSAGIWKAGHFYIDANWRFDAGKKESMLYWWILFRYFCREKSICHSQHLIEFFVSRAWSQVDHGFAFGQYKVWKFLAIIWTKSLRQGSLQGNIVWYPNCRIISFLKTCKAPDGGYAGLILFLAKYIFVIKVRQINCRILLQHMHL